MQTDMEITEDQLAIDWTLTDSDIQFINKNSNQNIKFAAQLCHLRAYGRFVGKDDVLPFTPLSSIAKQLGQSLSIIPAFTQDHHSYTQREKIRNYLGYGTFDDDESLKLQEWLVALLRKETMDKKRLIDMAIEGFHRSIAESLAPDKRKQLVKLITPKHKDAYAQLSELRTSPQNANSDVMNEYLDYFDEIEQLGILECNLSAIHPDVITELAKKWRYYTSTQLRDISSKLKQEAIIICFLQETAKTILDYIVNVFKRILLDTNRRATNEVSTEREKVSKKNRGKFKPASDFIKQAFSQAAVEQLTLVEFVTQFNEVTMLETASACEAIDKLEASGVTDNSDRELHEKHK